jgi:hypothetical protein
MCIDITAIDMRHIDKKEQPDLTDRAAKKTVLPCAVSGK